MRHLLLAALSLIFAVVLSGCTPDPAILAKQDELALAARMFAAIERGRTEAADFPVPAESQMKPGAYRGLATNVPAATPSLVGVHRIAGSAGSRAFLTYSVEAPNDYVLVTFVMVRRNGTLVVDRVATEELPRPLAELKRFRLADQGPGKLALLLLPLLALGILVAAMHRIWRSGRFGRRWLWTLGSLIGLGQAQILWPTGRVLVQPLYLSLLPAGFRQIGPYPDSWLFAASVPLVAIIVLVIRRARSARDDGLDTPSHPEASATH